MRACTIAPVAAVVLAIGGALVLVAAAPLAAQASRPKLPVASTASRALPPGGIPARALGSVPISSTLAAFQRSLQVSLDSVHWSTSIRTSITCRPGTNAACAPRTRPITVYLRWTPIDPPADMAVASREHPTLTRPYRVQIPGSRPSLCSVGDARVQPMPGFPVRITPSGSGGAFPITCTWVVFGVASHGTPAPGQSQDYMMYPSNAVTVVVDQAR
ncbi:MAG TPA: hypothetical protein VF166_14070 [Gemmatimonadaceae bacterium]